MSDNTIKVKWHDLNIFYGHGVYPPKPASLFLAEKALKIVKPNMKVLDACTGTGIVAIAIAKFIKKTKVVASDINPVSISTTKKNAEMNKVKILIVKSNLYKKFNNEEFDIITVHPPAVPYLKNRGWGMSKGMKIATNGGIDGSELVVRSIIEAKRCLKKNGSLILLLPNWSNIKKTYDVLNKNYKEVCEIGKKRIEFFPAVEGHPDKQLIKHIKNLARKRIIKLEFEGNKIFSYASVIKATK